MVNPQGLVVDVIHILLVCMKLILLMLMIKYFDNDDYDDDTDADTENDTGDDTVDDDINTHIIVWPI